MRQPEKTSYEFGRFRLDAHEHILQRDGEVIPITPKAVDLLVALVGNRGHVLSKEELMKQLWPDSFVEEGNLSHYIFTLRKALGEDKNGAKYIETIPRRGYRFVAEVIEIEDSTDDLVVAEHSRSHIVIEEQQMATAAPGPPSHFAALADAAATSRNTPRLKLAGLAVCLVAFGLVTAIYFWTTAKSKPDGVGLSVTSIAVLPFKSVGDGQGDSRYLADGISETLITKLTRLPNLRVIPWVTADRYRESTKPLQTVAEEMSVDALITGNVRRSGDRIAVTVSLIDPASGLQYWADEFDEPSADIFTVQRRIALGAARQLRGQLSSQQEQTLARSASSSAEAYEYYLRGRAALNQGSGSKELNQLALELLEKALEIDPNLAEAQAGIGQVEYTRERMGWGANQVENAEARFERALALNPVLAEAHIGLIRIRNLEGKSEDCLKYAQRAASLGLDDEDIFSIRARAYYFAGLWDKAVSMYQRAIEIDPASEDTNMMIVPSYLFAGEYNKAIEAGEVFFRKFHDAPRVHYFVALAYHCLGDFGRAKMHYEQAIKLAPDDTVPYPILGSLLTKNGQRPQARQIWMQGLAISKRKVDESPKTPALHGPLAEFYGQLGNREELLNEEKWVLKEAPDNGALLGSLGDAFARLGETERAVEYYRRAMHTGFLTFAPRALLIVDGTERLEHSPAYIEFSNELKRVTDRLREQY